jgi:uncharacterized protein (TIGR04255 family)
LPRRITVRKLEHAPLVQTLAQVRFAAVLDMADRVPALQREFKTIGFPRYQETQFPQLVLLKEGQPQVQFAKHWQFLSADRSSALVLSTDFVTLVSSAYSTFEQFLVPLCTAAAHLSTIGSVELMDRVGLRYIDLIRPRAGETIAAYVQPQLLGLSEDSLKAHGAHRTNVGSETQFTTRYGTLVVKLRQLAAGTYLPPDLNSELLTSRVDIAPEESGFALDCDHFREGLGTGFDSSELEKLLWNLHDVVVDAFKAAVTTHALTVWGPEREVAL